MTKVLIVDDEPQILRALRINLTARQYEVSVAADGTQALHAATSNHPDLIVLDLGLPDIDGIEVIRTLRTWTPVPIIVLSGRTGSRDKIDALDAGADDYVTKPFNVDELLARLRAVTRRLASPDAPATVRIGAYDIDLGARTVRDTATGGTVHLTRTEWQLLDILARHPGALITNASCYSRSGDPPTATKPTTCANTWPSYAENWKPTRHVPGTYSPKPGWATASNHRQGMGHRFLAQSP